MEVTILLGSPHLNGNTAALASGFSDGAKMAGANVVRIDVDQLGVSPVDAKLLKRLEAGENVDADGMDRVIDRLLASDVVVFATPLYYYGMSAQLKIVLDRFLARNGELQQHPARLVLLATSAGPGEEAMRPMIDQMRLVCGYLNWTYAGEVLATGLAVEHLGKARREAAKTFAEKLLKAN